MAIKTILAVLAFATSSSLFFSPAFAQEERSRCGAASYHPNEYTCYGNTTLCPTVFGLPTKPCGDSGGCYSPGHHSCGEDGTLHDLPNASSPFTLAAWGVRKAYQNQTVRACGGYLAFGANARSCHACTAAGGTNCASYKNSTVFLPDGRMVSGLTFYLSPVISLT